jgi:hypothetical protein
MGRREAGGEEGGCSMSERECGPVGGIIGREEADVEGEKGVASRRLGMWVRTKNINKSANTEV